MYLTKDGLPQPRFILGRLFAVARPCWVQNEMDGCSEHFFERPTRFEGLVKEGLNLYPTRFEHILREEG
jgi:hypothetical protein